MRETVPTVLRGVDGEPPTFVSVVVADTAEAALAYAQASGDLPGGDDEPYEIERVLMRELDPIACKARGLEHPWWVECTTRAKNPLPYWKIDG